MTETPWYQAFFGGDYARFDDHPRTAGEIRFLEGVLPERAGRAPVVLDLGCGMGRHAVRLERKGWRVYGVDLSETLLHRARSKRSSVRWIRADMRRIPLATGSCDAVISMFSSLGYFEDESENYRTLAEIARLLAPTGRVVVETANRDFLVKHAPPRSWFSKGGLIVLEERTFDPVAGRSEVDVVVIEGAARRTYHHSVRLYSAPELAMLFASLGVDTLDVFGDFDASPLAAESPRMIFLGERTST